MTNLRLNPAIDVQACARTYAEQKIVQIFDVFEPQSAEALEAAMRSLPWRLVYQDADEKNVMVTPGEWANMPAEHKRELERLSQERAASGLGFTYYTYPMIPARIDNWDPGHPIHKLTDFLNSGEFVTFARRIISNFEVTKIDAHASYYRPGDYLTTHRDEGDIKERRAAYTLGFSRNWRPDWGGLLLFHDDGFDISRGFLPRFNVLTVFDGLMPHTVTQVASFTPNPRYSVAGWFRDDPPFKKR